MKKSTIRSLSYYSLVLLFFADAIEYLSSETRMNFSGTEITSILKAVSLWCLLKYASQFNWKSDIPLFTLRLFRLVMIWGVITIIRGAIFSNGYADWKALILTNDFSLLIPYSIVVGIMFMNNRRIFQFLVKRVFKYGFLLLPISLVSMFKGIYPIIMIPVSVFLLISTYLKRKWFLLILLVGVLSVGSGFDMRSNMIRIIISVLLLITYFVRSFVRVSWLKIICVLVYILPFVFFYLGVTNRFNVFKPFKDTTSGAAVSESDKELTADTRTFLYQEVLASMAKHNSFIFGEGATAKYESAIFNQEGKNSGRYGSEVGFLNLLLYSGILGVFLYLLTLCTASYYALNYSNNFLCKMLGVYLAGRWTVFFIEDITKYDLNFYFLWIVIGLCFSKSFRAASDRDLKTLFGLLNGDIKLEKKNPEALQSS